MKILLLLVALFAATAHAKYIKIDESGAMLPDSAVTWSCIFDDTTALLWENKTVKNGGYTYTWYDENAEVTGTPSGGKCPTAGRCDTQKYLADNQGLCGAKDWRLPRIKELETLVMCAKGKSDNWIVNFQCNDYATDGQSVKINSAFFPNTSMSYWAADTYDVLKTSAYFVNFYTGGSERDTKWNQLKIRLVRDGHAPIAKVVATYPNWNSANSILTIPKFDSASPIGSAKIKFDFTNDSFVVLDVK